MKRYGTKFHAKYVPAPKQPPKQFVEIPAVRIPIDAAPALRSAIDEISNEIGGRLEGDHRFPKEEALTRAALALGIIRAAVNSAIPTGDPRYGVRTTKKCA